MSDAPSRQTFLAAAAAIFVVAGLIVSWNQARRVPAIDYYQFWAGGQLAKNGLSPHDPETRRKAADWFLRDAYASSSSRYVVVAELRRDLELYSTPFLYTAFSVFGRDYELALTLFQLLSFVSFIAAIVWMARLAGLAHYYGLLLAAFVLLAFQPMRSEIRVGNINQLQLLIVAAYVTLSADRSGWSGFMAGALFGATFCLKPNLLLMFVFVLAFLAISREGRAVAVQIGGAIVGVGGALMAAVIFYDRPAVWLEWFAEMRWLYGLTLTREMGNLSLVLPVAARVGRAANYAAAAFAGLLLLAALYRGRSAPLTPQRYLLVAGTGLIIHLLSSPLVWYHYFLLTLPVVIALLTQPRFQLAASAGVVFIAADPLVWLMPLRGPAETVIVNAGLVTLFAAAIALLARE